MYLGTSKFTYIIYNNSNNALATTPPTDSNFKNNKCN